MLIHASCVVLDERGVLLAGPSGVGKSDVALRLIVEADARLVADDQVELALRVGMLFAKAPPQIAGLIEARHVGVLRVPQSDPVPVVLYVELTPPDAELERLPEPAPVFLLDHPVRRLRLPAHAASTPAKIRATMLFRPGA
jgi:serine kinase of HPr protein (carbohydrate metabolism regulator)